MAGHPSLKSSRYNSPSSSCTKDVLVIISSVTTNEDKELLPEEVCYRKTGTLTSQDELSLRDNGIPSEYWLDEVRILEARFPREKGAYNVVKILNDPEIGASKVLREITDLCKTTSSFGILIWYCGPSRLYYGDWCLKHGFITLQHIQQIYNEYFSGKIMTVVSDCNYSGQWTAQWTQQLEEWKIKPCIHSSKKQKMYLSLISSCSGFETATKPLMALRGFCNSSFGDNMVRCFNTRIDTSQHTHCCITTMKTCAADFGAPCSLPEDYSWDRKRLDERIHLLRSRSFSDWAVVAVHGRSEGDNDRIKSSSIEDLKQFREGSARVLYSGVDRTPSSDKVVKFNSKFPMNNIRLNL